MNHERRAQVGELEAEHNRRVRTYYETAQPYYKLAWHGNTYGLHYGLWTEGIRTRHEAIANENRVLADLAQIKAGEMVLDAGCGVGGSGIWLAQNRGALVVGLNIVQKQLEIGGKLVRERRLNDRIGFQLGDYQDMPFPDRSFDVVWSLESIEHATNAPRFVQESYRVLKPGGRIVVAGTFLGGADVSAEQKRQMELGQAVSGCFNDFRTAEDIAQVMRDEGFLGVGSTDVTSQVMRSSEQMTRMCRIGLPPARIVAALHLVPRVMVLNTVWGTYQEGLFKAGATSYNTLTGVKPQSPQAV